MSQDSKKRKKPTEGQSVDTSDLGDQRSRVCVLNEEGQVAHSPNPQPPSHSLFNPAPPVALLISGQYAAARLRLPECEWARLGRQRAKRRGWSWLLPRSAERNRGTGAAPADCQD